MRLTGAMSVFLQREVFKMMKTQLYPANVIPSGKRHRLPELMTKQELLKFSKVIKRADIAMAVWISIFHGLRLGELARGDNKNYIDGKLIITHTDPLKWENVSFEKKEIKIVNGKNTKRYKSDYGKDRIVPIPSELLGIWKKWRLMNPDAVYVISSPDNKQEPVSKRVLQDWVRDYIKDVDLLKVHFIAKNNKPRYSFNYHTLRHMFGVNMIRKGVSIEKLQKLMGHSRIETTMIYTKLAVTDLHSAMNNAITMKKETSELTTAKELVKTMMNEMMQNMNPMVVKNV